MEPDATTHGDPGPPPLRCLFASDLHGSAGRYASLFEAVERDRPAALFLGGDLLPSWGGLAGTTPEDAEFLEGFLAPALEGLRRRMGREYPRVFAIFGNDDPRCEETAAFELQERGLWVYAHDRRVQLESYTVFGYAYVPPTPFRLKDWERYDVSRYTDPGCVSPEEGWLTVEVPERERRYATIAEDLERLAGDLPMERAVWLCHTPPYRTALDRAALDAVRVEHAPADVHVGSIALRRFLERRQPLVSLHGHVHESARLTGAWADRLGRTHLFSAAHDGPELALVSFDLSSAGQATRALIAARAGA